MHEEIIFSGFGGQGALFAGQLLAYAALDAAKHVTWIPSYGPEMRGGTAHCTVVISDEPIGSPLVRRPSSAVTLNRPSFEKYEGLVKSGGILTYNCSLIDAQPARTDIRYVAVPANEIGEAFNSVRLANMALLGAWLAASGVLILEVVLKALETHLSERQRRFLEGNRGALQRGAECVLLIQAGRPAHAPQN